MSNESDSSRRGSAACYYDIDEPGAQALEENIYFSNCDVLTPPPPDIEYGSNNNETEEMSNVLDSPWRGCAAYYRHIEGMLPAQCLGEAVYDINCRVLTPPLADIEYRSSDAEYDILHHVFRWDDAPYEEVFQNGFVARAQQDTPDNIFYNLDHYVHQAGRPLDSRRTATHAFVSTTLSSRWCSPVNPGTERQVYRYEIYAPGGIWVAETLGTSYRYPAQNEVAFVGGIAPQYIRSAQLFTLTGITELRTRRRRVNTELMINCNFNPIPSRLLNIVRPVSYCLVNGGRRNLTNNIWRPSNITSVRKKREVSTNPNSDTDTIDWYVDAVVDLESYINAAFRSSRTNEAYLFMNNEYVLLNYTPGTTNDKVLNGPLFICDGYPSLAGTAFAEYGIDCAFGSHNRDEAFIFSGNLCAQINYAPGTTNDEIIKGPMTITEMFPFFKGTVFKNGVDAAFEATTEYEAYLFKDNQYALINYGSNSQLIAVRTITQGFASLKNTMFESGIDAAFASHRTNEAYLFKKDYYALINFAPGTTNDFIIGGVKKIREHWPSLSNILPRKNHGLDVHDHTKPTADRDQDEL